MPPPLYPREKPGIHCTEGWVGPRAILDGCGKSRPYRDSIPRAVQPVASRYTDCAIPAHPHSLSSQKKSFHKYKKQWTPKLRLCSQGQCRMPEPFVDNVVRTSNLANVPGRLWLSPTARCLRTFLATVICRKASIQRLYCSTMVGLEHSQVDSGKWR